MMRSALLLTLAASSAALRAPALALRAAVAPAGHVRFAPESVRMETEMEYRKRMAGGLANRRAEMEAAAKAPPPPPPVVAAPPAEEIAPTAPAAPAPAPAPAPKTTRVQDWLLKHIWLFTQN